MILTLDEYLADKASYVLIDVRSLENIEKHGNIEHSKRIFKGDLIANFRTLLNKDTKYLLYCGSGNSATQISALAFKEGYQVYALEGGYSNYCAVTKP